ncbi:MAG: tetratricopeptide repeat protein [Betaproteobacteria bacterium]
MTPEGFAPAIAALDAARAALQRGDAALAEAKCREALALGLDDARTWALLGAALRAREPLAAESALRRALERDPRFVDAHFHLGNLYRAERRYAEAVAAYEQSLRLAPGHASILNNLGLALQGSLEPGRAETCFREVLRAQPQHRQAMGNLAHLLCGSGRYDEALALCDRYLHAFPDADATVWVDHGISVQQHLRDHPRAEASYRRAIALAPNDAAGLANLGSLLVDRSDFEAAADVLSRVADPHPLELYAWSLLALSRQHLCDWSGLGALHDRIADRIAWGAPDECLANPLAALSLPIPASGQRRVAEAWARFRMPPLAPWATTTQRSARARSAKLNLGYVSSDFRTHAIAFLLTEVWERHDRNRIETTAYSIGPREDSPMRDRIERAFDRFVDAWDETPARTAQRIRDDGIDVLIDLNGYTQGARSEIFAMRPAPVQVSWLGYLGTLGAGWIDYVLTDRYATPDELQSAFAERFLPLPDCYCPSDTRRHVAATAGSRADAGLPSRGFVFCCFNNTYKILPAVFDVWMRLLDKVPGSVLWLSPGNATAKSNLRREAAARRIDPDRLVFAAHAPPPEHLARHAHADLYLDTAPHGAGTTANDALLMGLPLLTCAGETMASRAAGSQLRAAGLPELVAGNLAEYESLALAIAVDPDLVAHYRTRLRASRNSAALFDMTGFTRNLESVLLSVTSAQRERRAGE